MPIGDLTFIKKALVNQIASLAGDLMIADGIGGVETTDRRKILNDINKYQKMTEKIDKIIFEATK